MEGCKYGGGGGAWVDGWRRCSAGGEGVGKRGGSGEKQARVDGMRGSGGG